MESLFRAFFKVASNYCCEMPKKLSKFNWSAVNPIHYGAGSLYLIAETEHRDEPRGGGGVFGIFV